MKRFQKNSYQLFLWWLMALPCLPTFAQMDIPVDLQSGRPIITLPLYQLQDGDLSVPIALTYNAGGVQVGTTDGKYGIGANWDIIAGGSITRTVRGLPDDCYPSTYDTRTGWLNGTIAQTVKNFTIANDNNASTCGDENQNYAILSSFGYDKDTEPDVFTIQFGSLSGQFVFDHEKKIRCIPFQNFDIQYDRPSETSAILSFTITTPDGVSYKFDQRQAGTMQAITNVDYNNIYFLLRHYNQYTKALHVTTEWGLSSITSPRGGKITFAYTSTGSSASPTQVFVRKSSGTDYASGGTNYATKILYTTTRPGSLITTQIQAGNHHRVDIISDDRAQNDINSRGTKIKVYAIGEMGGDQLLKRYKFDYFTTAQNPRKYLRSVQPISGCLEDPAYSFEYSGVNLDQYKAVLPGPDSYEQDYWGYYNANKAKSLNPTLYIYPNQPAQERYRLEPIASQTASLITLPGGFDRRPNASAAIAGTLNKVNYPVGGNARLYYESNEYYDAVTQTKFKGGGIRVNKIVMHDGISYNNDVVKEYQYDAAGGKLVNRPQFIIPIHMYRDLDKNVIYTPGTVPSSIPELEFEYFTVRSAYDLNTYSFDSPNVIYQTATEKQAGKGKTVYEFLTPALFGQTSTTDYPAPNHWEATYSYLARPSNDGACFNAGKIEPGYYTFPYPTNTNYSFERGLLKGVKVYNEAGQLLQEKSYTYQRLHQSITPVLISGLSFDRVSTFFSFGKYKLLTDVSKVTSIEKETTYDPTNLARKTDVIGNFLYDSPNHRMLSTSSTAISNDGTNFTTYKTKYKYPLDYISSPTSADATTQAIHRMKDTKMTGAVIEQLSTITKPGEGEKVTGASLNKYKIFSLSELQNNYSYSFTQLLPSQALSLQTNVPIADFSTSTVDGTYTFKHDSRYRVTRNYLDYNSKGHVRLENDNRQTTLSKQFYSDGDRPLLVMKNTTPAQMRYLGFDGGVYKSFDMPNPTYTLTAGRVGRGISAPAGYYFLIWDMERGIGPTYTFSCWAKTTTAGSLNIRIKEMGGPDFATKSIPYTNTTGVWTYYEVQLPVDVTKPTLFVEVNTSVAATLDDLLFCPSLAEVSVLGYEYQYSKVANTVLKSNVSNQVLFSNYDNSGGYTSFTGSYQPFLDDYGMGIQVPAGGQLSGTGLQRGEGPTYTFSCRIKGTSTNPGTITVSVSDNNNVVTSTKSFTFDAGGWWKYYEIQLPVSQTSPTINVTMTTNADARMDDVLFYPTLAKASNGVYNYQRSKTSQTVGGIAKFQEYDALGRPTLVSDQDNNILQRTLYHYKDQKAISAFFGVTSHPNGESILINQTVSFSSGSECEPTGITRSWNFGDGSPVLSGPDVTKPTHTYTNASTYTVTLTVVHAQYGTATYQQTITVKQPIAISICSKGVTNYNLCTKQALTSIYACPDNASANLPVGTNTFEAQVTNGCGTFSYKWEILWVNVPTKPNWEVLTEETTNKISITVTYPSPINDPLEEKDSYKIRCTVTSSCLSDAYTTNPDSGGTVTFYNPCP